MLTATSPPARVAGARAAFLVLALGALTGGCATLTRGVTQDIQIATDPTGAACELRRGEDIVDQVASTPGYVRVRKGVGRYALACSCFFFVLLGSPFAVLMAKNQVLTSFLMCFGPIAGGYYPLMLGLMTQAKTGNIDPSWSMWLGNGILAVAAWHVLRKVMKH